jgi:hypothetical protein
MKKIILAYSHLLVSINLILAQSVWFLQNPYPQTNPLLKVQAVTSNRIHKPGTFAEAVKKYTKQSMAVTTGMICRPE